MWIFGVTYCLDKVSPCGYIRGNDLRRYNPARWVIDAPGVDLKGKQRQREDAQTFN